MFVQSKMSISWDSSLVKVIEPRLRRTPEMLCRRVRSRVESSIMEAVDSSMSRSLFWAAGETPSGSRFSRDAVWTAGA